MPSEDTLIRDLASGIVELFDHAVGWIGEVQVAAAVEDGVVGTIETGTFEPVRDRRELRRGRRDWRVHSSHTAIAMLTDDQPSLPIDHQTVRAHFAAPG